MVLEGILAFGATWAVYHLIPNGIWDLCFMLWKNIAIRYILSIIIGFVLAEASLILAAAVFVLGLVKVNASSKKKG